MKILFVSAWFPFPPDNGSRIRVFNLIKAISLHHKVYLISLMQDDSSVENIRKLEPYCEVIALHKQRWFKPGTLKSIFGYFSSKPRSVVDTFNKDMMLDVQQSIKELNPDVILASTLGVVNYIPFNTKAKCILEQHNCEFALLRRSSENKQGLKKVLAELGWRKFAKWESEICNKFDLITMVSEADKAALLDYAPNLNKKVHVVSNGVDTQNYNPELWKPESLSLVYNGALTYGANFDAVKYFAEKIYPIYPELTLTVTGRYDGVDLSEINKCSGIKLAGYVDDIRDVLYKNAVCVVPLREGGGSRLKILEAMAAGIPVVSTTIGAEGIDVENGIHLLIADTPQDFANSIKQLLENKSFAESIRTNARKLVEDKYSWKTIGENFVRLIENAKN